MTKILAILFLLMLNPFTVLAAPEIPDNSIDEDADGWLATSYGYQLRATHPRLLLDQSTLQTVIERMYGPQARDPWKKWFEMVKTSEDSGPAVGLVELALLYKATGDNTYRTSFLSRLPTSGVPGASELYAVDIMWDEVSDAVKQAIMERVGSNEDSWYWQSVPESNSNAVNWGYHRHTVVAYALAYAGLFAFSDLELNKDPQAAGFNANNYIKLVKEELSDSGSFYQLERRVAGDPAYNNALPGSYGGMYDNFGYDTSEESGSINTLQPYLTLTGEDRTAGFLHDRYRGQFYQNMQYPYIYSHYDSNQWCRRAGTESHVQARIWNTQTDYINQPNRDTTLPLVSIYRDPRVQYYVHNGTQVELCGAPYQGIYWNLIFYDDSVPEDPPSSNPTAMYFNGPGLVSMRSDWSNDAAFAVFIAGEGISRRYEDGNSFILGRKGDVFPHGGARIRFNTDNSRHHWYHIRSVAKNTLKIFDPAESFDINPSGGAVMPLHSGPALVPSDNLGGQTFETPISTIDKSFNGAGQARYDCSSYPLGVCETANVIRFEHRPELGYTYTTGDAAAAYTRKIDLFEREFLFLRPDIYVIFDRVQSVDPSFRKVWTVHTVDAPTLEQMPSETGIGKKIYQNAKTIVIESTRNITYLDSLLPKQNRTTIRGGDTVIVRAKPLTSGGSISGADIEAPQLDIPRWLEFLGAGLDTEGSLTITGDAAEGNGTSETITFNDKTQDEVYSQPGSMTSASLTDDTQGPWQPDQFKNFMVRTQCSGSTYHTIITGNSEHTIYSNFPNTSCWGYLIYRKVANSYKHFTRITGITTDDLSLTAVTVSVPHYFDAEDALGRIESFAPHTDQLHDIYRKRKDLGQYTIETEAPTDANLTNFLNVVSLKDPGAAKPQVLLAEGDAAAGALIDSKLVVFAYERRLDNAHLQVPKSGTYQTYLFNLQAGAAYYLRSVENRLEISKADNGGRRIIASPAGSAVTTIGFNDDTVPAAPENLRVLPSGF